MEPAGAFDGDAGTFSAAQLVEHTITLEESGAQYGAMIKRCEDTESSRYWVEYQKNKTTRKQSRKKARWVDLELPPTEATSWWRLDGYGTSPEEDEEEEDEEEEDEEDEMELDEE